MAKRTVKQVLLGGVLGMSMMLGVFTAQGGVGMSAPELNASLNAAPLQGAMIGEFGKWAASKIDYTICFYSAAAGAKAGGSNWTRAILDAEAGCR